MILQLTIGISIIIVTIIVQTLLIACSIRVLSKLGPWLSCPPFELKNALSLAAFASWLVLGMGIGVSIWAITFQSLGAFKHFEPSLYFSVVTFTTLGYGDIVLGTEWRLLAGLAAADGLIIFGLNTAILMEFATRVRNAQEAKN